ncbi:MAG TPA: histidinol dehydrogenase, partial [Blastocatellia bacterium]
MEIVSYKPGARNAALDRISSRSLQMNAELIARVAEVVDGVRAGGDEALIHFTREYDGVSLQPHEIRVDPDFIQSAARRADSRSLEAFRHAIRNIRAFHEHQRESNWQMTIEDGATVGQRILPVASAGLYVPGG